jgi:hypothetical protein
LEQFECRIGEMDIASVTIAGASIGLSVKPNLTVHHIANVPQLTVESGLRLAL